MLIGLASIMLIELVYYQYKINTSPLPKLKEYFSAFIYDKVKDGSAYGKKLNVSPTGKPLSPPVLVGTNFIFDKLEWSQRFENVKFVLVVPHGLQSTKQLNVRKKLRTEDFKSVLRLVNFLNSNDKFQAATCENETTVCNGHSCRSPGISRTKTACRFTIRDWTMVIQNAGKMKIFTDRSGLKINGYECNIVDTAFVIRKDVFLKLKLRTRHGENTLYDFFTRSRGNLKIAKLPNCALSRDMNYRDRGYLEGFKEFPDYSLFGRDNKILRVIMPDKIVWTKCSTDKTLCPEKPLMRQQTLLSAVLPICCARVMDEMLVDTVNALKRLAIDYRVVFGTALGAVRSRSIIPWTPDIDLAIKLADYKNKTLFKRLQNVMARKYFVGDYQRNRRAIAHYPAKLDYDTSKLFMGENIKSDVVFSEEVMRAMEELMPLKNNWQERCYVDLYATYPKYAYRFDSSSLVEINGRKYISVANVTGELETWYGEKYMTPALRKSAPREDVQRSDKRKGIKRKVRGRRKGRKKGKGRKGKGKGRKAKRTKNAGINS